MNTRTWTILAVISGLLLLSGCATAPEREISRERVPYAVLPNGHDPLNPDQLPPKFTPTHAYRVAYPSLEEGVITYFERERGRALNILELSGGGQNGAFGAGFLAGWQESGTRPQFDLVTGVSAGALLATHAFLGTPADDAVLKELFTQVSQQDIYRKRSLLAIALGGADSAFDTAPLKALLDKHITEEVLQRVAAAYDEGRRLFVGTTNLDYNQTWVWSMSLIAKDNRPGAVELYRKVLLASASFPIAFPPVDIDGHLFGDGAARMNAVVLGLAGMREPKPPLYGTGNVYLIHNGRLVRPPKAIPNDIKVLAGVAIGDMMDSSMQAVMLRSYFGARVHGYRFKLVEIPAQVDVGTNPLAFNPEQMRAGFDAGYALGKKPDPWSTVPPNLGDFPPWALNALGQR
jgi:hypothetical protein